MEDTTQSLIDFNSFSLSLFLFAGKCFTKGRFSAGALLLYEPVKREDIEKNFMGYERREIPNGFHSKLLHVAWPEPHSERGGQGLGAPPPLP